MLDTALIFMEYFARSADVPPDDASRLDDKFNAMMRVLHSQHGASLSISLLTDDTVQDFITTHADILDSSMQHAQVSPLMRDRLEQSTYVFSGLKTYHELNEATFSLLDSDGNRKPFDRFLNDVQTVNQNYNHNYLRSEYNFVGASADMAARWESFDRDNDDLALQYRTAGDDHVRDEHAALEGITLPASDPFWESYYPPNGWNCRCTVVEVLRDKYPATDHDTAMQRADGALSGKYADMFRFNPGIQRRAVPAYNPYTFKNCANCDIAKGKLKFSHPIDCDTCQLCAHLTGNAKKKFNKFQQKRAETYIQKNVPVGGYTVNAVHSGITMKVTRTAMNNVVDHLPVMQKMKIAKLEVNLSNRNYIRFAKLGEGKNMNDPIDRNNVNRKMKQGIIGYNHYSVTIDNETYVLLAEVRHGIEYPYFLKKTKNPR